MEGHQSAIAFKPLTGEGNNTDYLVTAAPVKSGLLKMGKHNNLSDSNQSEVCQKIQCIATALWHYVATDQSECPS